MCRKCKGKGHYASKCTKASKSDARGAGSEEDSESDNAKEDEYSSSRLDRTWTPEVSYMFKSSTYTAKADAKYRRELRKENNNRRQPDMGPRPVRVQAGASEGATLCEAKPDGHERPDALLALQNH